MAIFTIEASEKEDFERWKKEHDAKVRADAIEDFVIAYIKDEEYDGCRGCQRIDDYCCIQCFKERYLGKLKEQKEEEDKC